MMKIIFTKSFLKKLDHLKMISKKDIITLVKKYPHTVNLITIDSFDSSKVLKGYLMSKKIRILILFEYVKGKFIPISIVRKETDKGKNICKYNYEDIFANDLDKIIKEYDLGEYEILPIK